jgi:hypothetical protein
MAGRAIWKAELRIERLPFHKALPAVVDRTIGSTFSTRRSGLHI